MSFESWEQLKQSFKDDLKWMKLPWRDKAEPHPRDNVEVIGAIIGIGLLVTAVMIVISLI